MPQDREEQHRAVLAADDDDNDDYDDNDDNDDDCYRAHSIPRMAARQLLLNATGETQQPKAPRPTYHQTAKNTSKQLVMMIGVEPRRASSIQASGSM
jgi:hypothetical protein